MSELDDLHEFTQRVSEGEETYSRDHSSGGKVSPAGLSHSNNVDDEKEPLNVARPKKWVEIDDGIFIPSRETRETLPPGIYTLVALDGGVIGWRSHTTHVDDIIKLPDTASDRVIESIQTFWASRDKFLRRKQLFKRGVIMWGPPGSGKTATVHLLMQQLVKLGGIVVVVSHPRLATEGLRKMRMIEPDRPVIVVLEDLDEIVACYGESDLLSLLDGEAQIDNVVYLATTNYPEKLDGRIINRPSRFDEVIKIGMPSAEARFMYLRHIVFEDEKTDAQITDLVNMTEGFSIAHLKELVVSIYCLGRDLQSTIARLKAMGHKVSSTGDRATGFGAKVGRDD